MNKTTYSIVKSRNFVSTTLAAQLLDCSVPTVRSLAESERFKYIRTLRNFKIESQSLLEYYDGKTTKEVCTMDCAAKGVNGAQGGVACGKAASCCTVENDKENNGEGAVGLDD